MKIEILKLAGDKTVFHVPENETVQQLMLRIAQKFEIGIDQVKLLFGGVNMIEYQQKVTSYGVKDGSTIHMVVQDKVTIDINVDLPNKTSQKVSVEPSEQTETFMKKLGEQYGYNVDNMELFHNGRRIQQGRLSHFGIGDGKVVQVRLKNPNITVKAPGGRDIQMDVSQMENAKQLKERLYRETGIPVSQQSLTANGKPFNSSHKPANLSSGTTVHMQGRTRGG